MRRWISLVSLLGLFACAGTVHQRGSTEPTWQKSGSGTGEPALTALAVPRHVVRFGLAPSVAERYPELVSAQVGLGISNRIVEALYGSQRFSLREEKADVVQRVAKHLALHGAESGEESGEESPAPPAVRWWLYGEVIEVRTAERETVRGLRGKTEVETTVTVQIRLLDHDSGRFSPATASGRDVRLWRSEFDGAAIAVATEVAVQQAVEQLLEGLER
jgi:hypothetical protein